MGLPPGGPVLSRDLRVQRGQTRAGDDVQGALPNLPAHRHFQVGVARSGQHELIKILVQRLHVDTGPASLVEGVGNRKLLRVSRSDIDVEAPLQIAERTPQNHVLVVLCVGNERHEIFQYAGANLTRSSFVLSIRVVHRRDGICASIGWNTLFLCLSKRQISFFEVGQKDQARLLFLRQFRVFCPHCDSLIWHRFSN